MRTDRTTAAITRAAAIIFAMALMLAGVTFAALRSQNNIINSSHLTSASANLQMSKTEPGPYANSLIGYDFFDLAAGGDAGPAAGNDLFLRNIGSTNLDIQVSLNSTRLVNADNADLAHVFLVITDKTSQTQYAKLSLADLKSAYQNGTPLPIGLIVNRTQTNNVKLRMQLGSQATSGLSQIEIQNIDFVFSGLSV